MNTQADVTASRQSHEAKLRAAQAFLECELSPHRRGELLTRIKLHQASIRTLSILEAAHAPTRRQQ